MENKPKTTAKDFFLHLGVIATLYVSAVSLLILAFRVIDAAFPTEGLRQVYYSPSISGPVATLIVVFPLFLFLSWLLNNEYRRDPLKRELTVRKWLLYITLFVAGIVVVVDLITVLVSFLSGELITLSFILKVVAVFVVASAIFGYYIFDLRNKTQGKINRLAFWKSVIIVLALIVIGFMITGSPRTQRLIRVDQQKVNDLQNIQWQVVNFWQAKERLPDTLSELEDPLTGFILPNDPQTGEPYVYRKTSDLGFELCADFNLESKNGQFGDSRAFPIGTALISESENWQHGEGEECFERTLDPDRFPSRKI